MHGRGAQSNPHNKFQAFELAGNPEPWPGEEEVRPQTQYLEDSSKSILSRNSSPDIPWDFGVNPYRGCEHGCAYCYARPSHEYLGFSAGLDFEARIVVKRDAPALLREALGKPGWKPQVVMMSGVTDCYQPVERRLRLTRGCLEVFAEFRNPVSLITKNHLVTRDLDVLRRLADHQAVSVSLSITTLRPELSRILEPRASMPARRLAAVRALAEAGIPVKVMVAPVIPALNDHELPEVLAAAAEAGALDATYLPLRLPATVQDVFTAWLAEHFPDRQAKVIHRIQSMRGGALNDPRFHNRFQGEGAFADQLQALYQIGRRKAAFPGMPPLSTASFQVPGPRQLDLFSI